MSAMTLSGIGEMQRAIGLNLSGCRSPLLIRHWSFQHLCHLTGTKEGYFRYILSTSSISKILITCFSWLIKRTERESPGSSHCLLILKIGCFVSTIAFFFVTGFAIFFFLENPPQLSACQSLHKVWLYLPFLLFSSLL